MQLTRRRLLTGAAALAATSFMIPVRAKTTLHLTHIYNLEDLRHQAAVAVSKEVAERTNGEFIIDVHPMSQMAGLRDGVEGVRLGTMDMTVVDTATISNWNPALGAWSLPFLFDGVEHAKRAMTGEAGKLRTDGIRQAGLESVGHAIIGFRVLLGQKPMDEPDAMKGVKFRVPEIPVYVSTFRALGCNVTPVPWGETYSALQAGVVDAVEGDPVGLTLARHHEVTKFASRTNHIFLDNGMLINPDIFSGLPQDVQTILMDAGARHFSNQLSDAQIKLQQQDWEAMSKVVKVTEQPDIASFTKATAPVIETFSKRTRSEAFLAAVAAAR